MGNKRNWKDFYFKSGIGIKMGNKNYEKLDFSDKFSERYKEFTPILNEYFSRMKADLDLSDEQIDNKVNLLLKNVKKIKFAAIPLLYKGQFRAKERKILLNASMLNYPQDSEELFNIITHELGHACSLDKQNKKFGMYRRGNGILAAYNSNDCLLDEIRTEISSTRRVYNDNYTDEEKMIRNTYGYKNYSAFSTMLQNCLGITEKEFIQASDNGRADFDKQMETKFANPEDYKKFMEKFSMETTNILNIRLSTPKMTRGDKKIVAKSFDKLQELSYVGLNLKMEKDILDNPNMNIEEYLKNMRYSIEENSKNFEDTVAVFGITDKMQEIRDLARSGNFEKLMHPHLKNRGTKEQPKSKAQNMLESKIMYLEMLSENKELLGDKYIESACKITSIKEVSELKEYSKTELDLEFKNNEEKEFKKELDCDIIEKRKAEKEKPYVWDNKEIIDQIESFIEVSKSKKINKLYVKIIKIMYPHYQKFLDSSKENGINEQIVPDKSNELKHNICNMTKSDMEISVIDNERTNSNQEIDELNFDCKKER